MALFPRGDIAAVSISEAHGGCGKTHSRPVENGAPVKVWEFTCPDGACEDHLRHDPNWSTNLAELPETPDAKLVRERDEKMGKLDRENQLAAALIELGKLGDLPAALAQAFGGIPAALAGKMVCPEGHDNPAGQKFCGSCGAAMHAPANAIAQAPQAQAAHLTPGGEPEPAAGDLTSMHWKQLEKLCKDRGLDATGSKADLLGRLTEPVAA